MPAVIFLGAPPERRPYGPEAWSRTKIFIYGWTLITFPLDPEIRSIMEFVLQLWSSILVLMESVLQSASNRRFCKYERFQSTLPHGERLLIHYVIGKTFFQIHRLLIPPMLIVFSNSSILEEKIQCLMWDPGNDPVASVASGFCLIFSKLADKRLAVLSAVENCIEETVQNGIRRIQHISRATI